MLSDDAKDLNTLAAFLGRRDVPSLTGVRADVLILFGGCPPEGWDIAARAHLAGAAGRLLLCGGAGHTTPMLMAALGSAAETEADLMAEHLAVSFGITDCLIERASTNSGTNIAYAEQVLRLVGLTPDRMILVQDASMQQRMDAVVRRVWTLGTPEVINFAGTSPRVEVRDGALAFAGPPQPGMWSMEHWITLLMGEIPRLADDGYGPAGRDFLAHVDIPAPVTAAFEALRETYGDLVRRADDRFGAPPASAD